MFETKQGKRAVNDNAFPEIEKIYSFYRKHPIHKRENSTTKKHDSVSPATSLYCCSVSDCVSGWRVSATPIAEKRTRFCAVTMI